MFSFFSCISVFNLILILLIFFIESFIKKFLFLISPFNLSWLCIFSPHSFYFLFLLIFYSFQFNSEIENLLLPFDLFFLMVLTLIILIVFFLSNFFSSHPSTFYFLRIGLHDFFMYNAFDMITWFMSLKS